MPIVQIPIAIKNYKQSVELNPGNQNGIVMLKKLGVNTVELTKELVISNEILNSYVGKYELMPGFVMTISKEGTQMKAQATGQQMLDSHQLLPQQQDYTSLSRHDDPIHSRSGILYTACVAITKTDKSAHR